MATVFMKWLETSPRQYDKGIQILTMGRLKMIWEKIALQDCQPGKRVLDLGCGTGSLAGMMAEQGAIVTGIDASPMMLAEAQRNMAARGLEGKVTLAVMDAAQIGERFPPDSFDLIVATLIFSELSQEKQKVVLDACAKILTQDGQLLIADEVLPESVFLRLTYYLAHGLLKCLTWILTRATTRPLVHFDLLLSQSGYQVRTATEYLGRSLALFDAVYSGRTTLEPEPSPLFAGQLRRQRTMRSILIDLWALFFRIVPPYPRIKPGLYRVGNPSAGSVVLVTGNFELTVRRLVTAIDEKIDAWILVADSAGINVWCGAGGGYFTAEKIIAELKSTHLDQVVNHRSLILPQLCANGVDGGVLQKETGWRVQWGPVRAKDIPAYLEAGRVKTDRMRLVQFPLLDRLEMAFVTLGFYALIILVPVWFLFHSSFWKITASLTGLSLCYAIVQPWLPGRNGLRKSISLTAAALAGLFIYQALWGPMAALSLFYWALGLTGLSVFAAAEMQGMSPVMRGEQENWKWEAIIGIGLGLTAWLLPAALGWR